MAYQGYEWGQLMLALYDHPHAVLTVTANRDLPVRIDYFGGHYIGMNVDDSTARKLNIWLEKQRDRASEQIPK